MPELILDHTQINYSDKNLLEIGEKGRACRFCKKTSQVTFDKRAHSIPELLGNKSVFTINECDVCNRLFSDYERHLSRFIPPSFITRLKGKKGHSIMTFKGNDKISGSHSFIDIEHSSHIGDNIDLTGQKYLNVKVYKSLLKSLISLLPDQYVSEFNEHIEWIRSNKGFNFTKINPFALVGINMSDINTTPLMRIRLSRFVNNENVYYFLESKFNNFYIYFPFSPTCNPSNFNANNLSEFQQQEGYKLEEERFSKKFGQKTYRISLELGEPDFISESKLDLEALLTAIENTNS